MARIAAHDILGNLVSTEQRDFFEFTTVKQGNKLIPVYHGSKEDFNEFNHELIGKNGDEHGPGFYFTASEETANMYGTAKMYYLDIMRPIKVDKLTFNYDKVYNFLKRLDPDGSHYLESFDDVYSNGIATALNEATHSLLEYSENNWALVCDVYGGYNGDMKHFCETVKKCLGDGIVYYDGAGGANYIVMTSKQIKLASNISPKYGTSKVTEKYTLDESLFLEDTGCPFGNSKVQHIVYHTSNKDFDRFDSRKKGSNTGWIDTNLGYFFSDNEEITKQFGTITKQYYINLRKPFDLRIWRGIRAESFDDLNNEEKQIVIDLTKIFSDLAEPTEEYIQNTIDAACDFDAQGEIREQLSHKDILKNVKKLGYDGIIDIMDRNINANEFIVFNSNQIVTVK